jgi:Ca2+/H+ antiporter
MMKQLKKLLKKPQKIAMLSGVVVMVLLVAYMFIVQTKIKSHLQLFKDKMEEAGESIEQVVVKFKQAGGKYDTAIEELKKEVASLKKTIAESPTPSSTSGTGATPSREQGSCEAIMREAKACLAKKRLAKKQVAKPESGEFVIEDDDQV